MDPNGISNTPNTRVQPPTHPYFQSRRPQYVPPPNAPVTQPATKTIPPPQTQSNLRPTSAVTPISSKPTPSNLPTPASISLIQKEHIEPLRRINSLLLPISYPDSFYKKILAPDPPISFSRVIFWKDPSKPDPIVIGGIVCRLDPALAPSSTPQNPIFQPGVHDIYIQSLALLSPYRGKGLVAAVLDQVIEAATGQQDIRVASLYAHVWTHNEEALRWYDARQFKREEPVIHGYYRRLKPDTAWIFRRRLSPIDHLQHAAQGTQLRQIQPSPSPGTQLLSTPPISIPSTPLPPPPPAPTPTTGAASRPPPSPNARSFQERGPDREWNDLPDDVLLKASSRLAVDSQTGSAASSRSSSRSGTEKGRKKRVYPTAAYGS